MILLIARGWCHRVGRRCRRGGLWHLLDDPALLGTRQASAVAADGADGGVGACLAERFLAARQASAVLDYGGV